MRHGQGLKCSKLRADCCRFILVSCLRIWEHFDHEIVTHIELNLRRGKDSHQVQQKVHTLYTFCSGILCNAHALILLVVLPLIKLLEK